MQTKIFNAYRITHENGSIEDINALDLVQALDNLDIPDTESTVVQAFLIKKGVKTLVEDEPTEIIFSTVVEGNGGNCIATPASGRLHVGDMIDLQAIPDRNYEFVSWKMNNKVISNQEKFNLTIPELPEGIDTIVFTATFRLSDVAWTTKVMPEGASTAGCIAFPTSGTSGANTEQQLLAVPKGDFTFSHWERHSQNVSTNELATVTVNSLAEDELDCVYVAVFNPK